MKTTDFLKQMKQHPRYDRVGMILTHTGVVRGTSRDGRRVTGMTVSVDSERLKQVIAAEKASPGIVDVLVRIAENRSLSVGDEIMTVAVAGDIRDHVIPALERTLKAIKQRVIRETEIFGK
jgi:molybdopterin synthase catalytic subunit